MQNKIAWKRYNCIFVRLWQTRDYFLGVCGQFKCRFFDFKDE